MQWLNYHHLYYFWRVATLKSVTRASQELRLAQPTVSAQLKSLESAWGISLFEKKGRELTLTGEGQIVFRYAQEIFALGQEMQQSLSGREVGSQRPLRIGLSDALPKILASKIISPALSGKNRTRVICSEGPSDKLLADLALQDLDLVISDCPIPPQIKVRAYNHLLGSSTVDILASQTLKTGRRLPLREALSSLPVFLPSQRSALRRNLDMWFEQQNIKPLIIAEFQDSALLKMSALKTPALLPVPSNVSRETCHIYGFRRLGTIAEITEQIYLISIERQIRHPGVAELIKSAAGIF